MPSTSKICKELTSILSNLTNFHSLENKWNKSGFRPPLCTYRLNWARRTSWGWWDDWDDTVLQTQDSKFEPWRSEAEHAFSRSRRLPTILTFTRGWGRNIFCFFQTAETGNRTPNSGVKGSGANHYPRAPAPLTWSCGSRQRDTTSSGWKFKLNNLAGKGLRKLDRFAGLGFTMILPAVDTVIPRAKLCRWADLTFPPFSFSAYPSTLVIGWITKRCTA